MSNFRGVPSEGLRPGALETPSFLSVKRWVTASSNQNVIRILISMVSFKFWLDNSLNTC